MPIENNLKFIPNHFRIGINHYICGLENQDFPKLIVNVFYKPSYTMIPQFEGLNDSQKELMLDAFPLITVYIAGADGKIDQEETAWSEKIADIRTYSSHESLKPFYEELDKDFSLRLVNHINNLPGDVENRTKVIEEKLSGLNDILSSLDVNLAARLYKDFISFAKQIAKASGGFMGFASVSRSEEKLLNLDMINPIVIDEEEETEG